MHYCKHCQARRSGSHRQHRDNPNFRSKMQVKKDMDKYNLDTSTPEGLKNKRELWENIEIQKLITRYKKTKSPMLLQILENKFGLDLDLDISPDGNFNRA